MRAQCSGIVTRADRNFRALAGSGQRTDIAAARKTLSQVVKDMLDSLVKIDNTLVWDGHSHPFYEAYYLIISHPKNPWALWLRYTLTHAAPHKYETKNENENVACLCAIYMEKSGRQVALKNTYELSKHDIVHTDQFIAIGGSCLSLAEATGSVQNGKDCIKWELSFEDPVQSLRIYPGGLFYHLGQPSTKFVQPRLVSAARGTFYVNHEKKELRPGRVHQGHLWGRTLSKRWAWANCLHFKEDSEAWFQALSIETGVGPVSRSLNFFCLSMEGKKFNANSALKMLLNKSDYDDFHWHLRFTKSHFRFDCHIEREARLTAGIALSGPGGEKRYSYLSPFARMEIKVYKNIRGRWQYYKTLSAENGATFETVATQKSLPLNLK